MAAKNGRLVAITGANGTIGYACVVKALQEGYRVRCVVRREDAISALKAGPSLQPHIGRIEFAIVPDNSVSGAYDSAFEGATHVVHIAGVWPKPHYHPDSEIYHPFVKSMENVLTAATNARTVRRVVFTQAGAALVNPNDGDTLGIAMAAAINEYVPVNAHSASLRPPLASSHHAYCGAKAFCMTRLKELRASGELPFSVVQVIPGTVMGPSELASSAAEASTRMDRMAKALLFNGPPPRYAFGFVHVEDCAEVHISALDEAAVPEGTLPDWFIAAAPSERGKSGADVWREAGDEVKREFRQEVASGVFTVGRENMPINMPFYVDSRMTESMLLGGKRFRDIVACVKDVGHWYKNLVIS